MKKTLVIAVLFLVSSCASVLVPVENFNISLIGLRDLRENKIKHAPTNTRYTNTNGNIKELVFSTNLNLATLILKGYGGYGHYSYGKTSELCIIYDETMPVIGEHLSLSDLSLKPRQYAEAYLRELGERELYTYSCVIDTGNITNQQIAFHVELAYFITYKKYISNIFEVKIKR